MDKDRVRRTAETFRVIAQELTILADGEYSPEQQEALLDTLADRARSAAWALNNTDTGAS